MRLGSVHIATAKKPAARPPMSNFAKAEILKFAAFRQMLIAGRLTPQAPTLVPAVSPGVSFGPPSVLQGALIPRDTSQLPAVSPFLAVPDLM